MTDAQRIAALEEALEDVLKRLDPQTLAQALERTWSPRGGEPRIVDSSGRTLDYTPSIQFLNATTELDVPAQRVVVTPTSGGGGALAGEFSQDAVTTDAERLKFFDPGNPSVNQLQLDTLTLGTTRAAAMVVAEDVGAGPTNFGGLSLLGDDTSLLGAAVLTATSDGLASSSMTTDGGGSDLTQVLGSSGPGGATLSARASSIADGTVSALVAANTSNGFVGTANARTDVQAGAEGGEALIALEATSSAGHASLELSSDGTTLTHAVTAEAGGRTALVIDESSVSSFVQGSDDSTNDTPRQRWVRGPFTASPGSLAAGATASVVVNSVSGNLATWRVVSGHIEGGAGVEEVLWSMDPSTVTPNVSISFTNTGSGALTASLAFVVVSDS